MFIKAKEIKSAKSGFTIIEMLVTIGLISLLLAILLPAVQNAREAARRTSCQNNLKQIGLALQNFEATHNSYPPVYAVSDQANLLPFLDQAAIFERHGFGKEDVWWGTENGWGNGWDEVSYRLPVFLCPSHPEFLAQSPCHYLINWGTGPRNRFDGLRVDADGTAARISDITDGLSNTLAFAEGTAALGDPFSENYQPDFSDRGLYLVLAKTDIFTSRGWNNYLTNCQSRLTVVRGNHDRCNDFASVGVGIMSYNHLFTPNRTSCTTDSYEKGIAPPSSYHVGGVFVSACDGSSRFVSDFIDADVWSALGSRAGGEVSHVW